MGHSDYAYEMIYDMLIKAEEFIRIIVDQATVPVVVDAGLGMPSHAAQAIEMGADAVLVNTAIAAAGDPVKMAHAFRLAVEGAEVGPRRRWLVPVLLVAVLLVLGVGGFLVYSKLMGDKSPTRVVEKPAPMAPAPMPVMQFVKIVRPDRVRLEFDDELNRDKKNKKVEILIPEIQNKDVELGRTKNGETKTARLKVKLNGIDSVECTVHVLSSRGGHLTKEITIGK